MPLYCKTIGHFGSKKKNTRTNKQIRQWKHTWPSVHMIHRKHQRRYILCSTRQDHGGQRWILATYNFPQSYAPYESRIVCCWCVVGCTIVNQQSHSLKMQINIAIFLNTEAAFYSSIGTLRFLSYIAIMLSLSLWYWVCQNIAIQHTICYGKIILLTLISWFGCWVYLIGCACMRCMPVGARVCLQNAEFWCSWPACHSIMPFLCACNLKILTRTMLDSDFDGQFASNRNVIYHALCALAFLILLLRISSTSKCGTQASYVFVCEPQLLVATHRRSVINRDL